MTTRARILMLEPNRYRALLLQRALTSRIPGAIAVRFVDAEAALMELPMSIYDAAIINPDSLTAVEFEQMQATLEGRPLLVSMFLVSPEGQRKRLSVLASGSVAVLVSGTAAPDEIAKQLARLLSDSRCEQSEKHRQPASQLHRLTLNGE